MTAERTSPMLPLAAALVVSLTAGGAAKADTIYDFDALVSTGVNAPIAPVGFELTLADGFLPEAFSRNCYPNGCISSGNFADFSLKFTVGSELLGVLNDGPDTQFEYTDGTINGDSGNLTWATSVNTVFLSFGDGLWSATVFSDNPELADACGSAGCTASGIVAEVPEPAAFEIFAAGLIGIAVAWLRRPARAGRASPHLT